MEKQNRLPTVPVVITTHNRTDTACKTIASLVKNLKYSRLNWIIADDRSDDSHIDRLVQAFRERGVEHVTICQTNEKCYGLGSSLNNGLREAFNVSPIVLRTEDDWYLQKELDLYYYVKTLVDNECIAAIRLAAVCNASVKPSCFSGFLEVYADGKCNSVFNNQVALCHRRIYDSIGYYLDNVPSDESEQDMVNRFNISANSFKVLFPSFIKMHTLNDKSLFFMHFGKSTVGHSYALPDVSTLINKQANKQPQQSQLKIGYDVALDMSIHLSCNSKIAVLATIKERTQSAKNVIDTISKQVDLMIVALNGFTEIPSQFPVGKNIQYFLAGPNQQIPDLGCDNKFAWLGRFPGYYFTVDDDIIYPEDYCATLVKHMKKFNNSVVCSYEGRRYSIVDGKPKTLDFKQVDVFSFYKSYADYNFMHRGGCGVACFYPQKLPFDCTDYITKPKNFGDDEITAVLCQKHNIKIIRPPSVDNYLKMDDSTMYIRALHTNSQSIAKRNEYLMHFSQWRRARNDVDIGCVKYKNLGDSVSLDVVQKMSLNQCNPIIASNHSRRPCIMTIGSILHHAIDGDVVWGTGFISDSSKYGLLTTTKKLKVLALRGPMTNELLHKSGIDVDLPVYGDPGIFIPYAFGIARQTKKSYSIGVVPHVEDYDLVSKQKIFREGIALIDFRKDFRTAVEKIAQCERIVSSSLHGLIIAEALGIPAAWVLFSNKVIGNGFKFKDYYLGSGRTLDDVVATDWRYKISIGTEKYMPPATFDVAGLLDAAPFFIDSGKKQTILDWFK